MFERTRLFGRRGNGGRDRADDGGGVATAERDDVATRERAGGPPWRNGDGNGDGNGNGTATATTTRPRTGRRAAEGALVADEAARLRARERFGGTNWGAGFFGWLVALGLGALLSAIVAAAGTAIGLTNKPSSGDAGTIGIVGGALLLAIGVIAYFAGGYVAGRMSRFDGARQGAAAWVIGLIVTLVVGGAGAIFGSQYNVFSNLHLPRIPIDEGSLTTGGAIFLGAFLIGTLLASLLGGTVGRRYHRRVDLTAAGAR